jgi:hypothetical protein
VSNDLVISINGTTDTLTIQNYFTSGGAYKIEQVQFDNGTVWTTTDLDAALSTPGAGITSGTAATELYDLRNSANSTVYGYTSTAADSGNDTYLFGRNAGQDTVLDYGSAAGNTDVAKFMSGITSDQLWFKQTGNNLDVSIIGTTDKLTVQNWYSGSQYHIEQFKTVDDNKTLLDSQVQNLVNAMAAFSPPAAGQTTLPSNYATTLNPVIAANWQ